MQGCKTPQQEAATEPSGSLLKGANKTLRERRDMGVLGVQTHRPTQREKETKGVPLQLDRQGTEQG